jgi:hypothetical protein
MSKVIGTLVRNIGWRKAALAAGALTAVMAGAMPALASDATATRPHRSGAYASARGDQQPTTTPPARHKEFQDYK